jgi:hypothetical protein
MTQGFESIDFDQNLISFYSTPGVALNHFHATDAASR